MNAISRASRREPASSPELTGRVRRVARLRVRGFDQHAEHRLACTPHACPGPRPVGQGVQPRCLRCRSLARSASLTSRCWSARWTSRFACTPRCILVLTAPRSCALTTTSGCSWSAVRPRDSGCSRPEPGVAQHRRASTNGTWSRRRRAPARPYTCPFPRAYAPARPRPRTVHSDESPINVPPGFAAAWWGFNSVAS
jgi:hypothetical protein